MSDIFVIYKKEWNNMLPTMKYIGSWIKRTQHQTPLLNIGCSIKIENIGMHELRIKFDNLVFHCPANYLASFLSPAAIWSVQSWISTTVRGKSAHITIILTNGIREIVVTSLIQTDQRYRHLSPQEYGSGCYNSRSWYPTIHLQLVSCLGIKNIYQLVVPY